MGTVSDDLPSLFIQWKGTTVCGDFACLCGNSGHICGAGFMYSIKCGSCGRTFGVDPHPKLTELSIPARDDDPAIVVVGGYLPQQ